MKYKALAILCVIITTVLSPFLVWFWFLDVITDGAFSVKVCTLWDRKDQP